jgi:hypothetical protein
VTRPGDAHTTPAPHVGRAERTLTTTLPVLLAVGVFAVSFAHVHDVAAWAGQPDWAAWLVASSVELMALASIVEIRHRRRLGAGTGWPVLTLAAGTGMSGAANLAAAGRTLTGPAGIWTPAMAVWPVLAFALVAGLKATRPTHHRAPAHPTGRDRPAASGELPGDLAAAARHVATQLTATGHPVTKTALARGVRTAGYRISTDRARLLLDAVTAADDAPATTRTGTPRYRR